jgi:hypothetical protein
MLAVPFVDAAQLVLAPTPAVNSTRMQAQIADRPDRNGAPAASGTNALPMQLAMGTANTRKNVPMY